MRHLVVYYSRIGFTRATASLIAEELRKKGEAVELAEVVLIEERSAIEWWLRVVPRFLWRRIAHKEKDMCEEVEVKVTPKKMIARWKTAEVEPSKLSLQGYEVVWVGSPHWCVPAYPIRAFLKGVDLSGKKVVIFVTCGGPVRFHELFQERYFCSVLDVLEGLARDAGGEVVAKLMLSDWRLLLKRLGPLYDFCSEALERCRSG